MLYLDVGVKIKGRKIREMNVKEKNKKEKWDDFKFV